MTSIESQRTTDGPPPPITSRYGLIAALMEAESLRSGDRIGYQYTIVDVLHCLEQVELGRMSAQEGMDRIYERIVLAVDVDPFDPQQAG